MHNYEKGERIRSLDQLQAQTFIWDDRQNKVYNHGWFCSWQFRYVVDAIKSGWLYTVIDSEEKKKIDEERSGFSACMNGAPYDPNKSKQWQMGWKSAAELCDR